MTPEEYKTKLNLKLTTLTAVLIMAIKKIEKGMSMPDANVEHLTSIRNSLANMLSICQRAQLTLATPGGAQVTSHAPSGAREYTEMTSLDEYRKFQDMEPISQEEIAGVDWNQLMDQLKDV